ncbi:hypothetical protein [Streptacidiphilus albus]|uniref:hypothetical protein n=1 Tax=Streptacidiphilus albus TaxID=105425 RepID=UPI00054B5967|nr:hypothetical protein [Streptacidiphilus albus]
MTVTLSLVAFFALVLVMMLRSRMVSAAGAIVAALFGFYLAATGAAAPINHFIVGAFGDLTHLL